MSAISVRRTASWAEASPTSARSSLTRVSRAESVVVVVVDDFLAAQAACPDPSVVGQGSPPPGRARAQTDDVAFRRS